MLAFQVTLLLKMAMLEMRRLLHIQNMEQAEKMLVFLSKFNQSVFVFSEFNQLASLNSYCCVGAYFFSKNSPEIGFNNCRVHSIANSWRD